MTGAADAGAQCPVSGKGTDPASGNRSSTQCSQAPDAEACSVLVIKRKDIDRITAQIMACMHFQWLGNKKIVRDIGSDAIRAASLTTSGNGAGSPEAQQKRV